MNKPDAQWDVQYEWRVVLLMMLAFGLVGLDRFAINPLFPAMMKDLNLDYQDLGNAAAALAVTWGISSAFMGRVSDRLGRRKVLIPAVIVFSCLAGFTGLVTGITGLLLLRAIMGVAEGAFMPASIAATIEASKPTRRGFNFGFQQNGLPIIGLGLGPIIATQLLAATGSWRWAFVIVCIPGFLVAFLMYKILRDTQGTAGSAEAQPHSAAEHKWSDVFRYRNVVMAILIMICIAGSLNVVIAMTPNYLSDYLHIDVQKMGFIVSATGFGAFIGGIALPALSDRWGRKIVMLVSGAVTALAIWMFMGTAAEPVKLFLLLFVISGFGFSVIYINVGPLTMESVPAAISSTAVGVVIGVGEIIGGGIAPSLAGYIAKHYGIQHVFSLCLAGSIASVLLIMMLREPQRSAAPQPTAAGSTV